MGRQVGLSADSADSRRFPETGENFATLLPICENLRESADNSLIFIWKELRWPGLKPRACEAGTPPVYYGHMLEPAITPASRPDLPEARGAIGGILALSAVATLFLFWLLFARQAPPQFARSLTFLPKLNALFNGLSALSLCAGFCFILRRRVVAHQRAMVTAFVFSTLFLHQLHPPPRAARRRALSRRTRARCGRCICCCSPATSYFPW